MAVDLLIVNFNTRDKLQRLLDELHSDYEEDVWRLYIWDNNSSDDTVEWLESEATDKYDLGMLFYSEENVGYAAACNAMAEFTSSEYLALLNADVWMKTSDVQQLASFMENVDNVGAVGPKQRDEQGRVTHAGVFGSNVKPEMRGWMKSDENDVLYRHRDKCVTISGSAYFVPRAVWDEMTNCPIYQEFNENRFGERIDGAFLNTKHYYEETALSYHLTAHNYDVWYDGTVSIGHTWHASSPRGGFADKKFKESRSIFRDFCDLHNIYRD